MFVDGTVVAGLLVVTMVIVFIGGFAWFIKHDSKKHKAQ
ncbi:cytochrome c oxidase subunit CcoM [Zooshikella sp. RANM57]